MLALIEEARARIEAYLGWAMLIRFSVCCKASVTLVTQRRLAEAQAWPWSPVCSRNYIGRSVQRLLHRHLAPVANLANRAADTPFPVISRRNGGFLGPEPLRRVRVEHVEHVTEWSNPGRRPHYWPDLRTPFRSRGFDAVAEWTEDDGNVGAPHCWRQITNRQLTENVYAQLVTTTARFLWNGFHVELVERTMDMYEYSDDDLAPSGEGTPSSLRSRSPSSGRRLRRQHHGLEHS